VSFCAHQLSALRHCIFGEQLIGDFCLRQCFSVAMLTYQRLGPEQVGRANPAVCRCNLAFLDCDEFLGKLLAFRKSPGLLCPSSHLADGSESASIADNWEIQFSEKSIDACAP
jgi:hypothetical protein